ncbi:MAG: hydrogenase expression/formation protein HypE [Candidatus Nezhaarchaeales archaeon]
MSEFIQLVHGGGGTAMMELLSKAILPKFTLKRVGDGIGLDEMDDGATLPLGEVEVVVTIDAHTVDPIFFPGGDIGRLAAAGTINDLAVMGARPIAIVDAIVIEEGFPIKDLERIVRSMDEVAMEVGAAIIGGDLKVMPKGKVDKVVITTCGLGVAQRGKVLRDSGLRPGDLIIVTGTIGDHGIALASVREGLSFETELKSDVAPIWDVVEAALKVGGITAAKDPTRGGVAAALNEVASKSGVGIRLWEGAIPIREEVRAASEMLGLDPLEVTCEGRAILGVERGLARDVLEAVRATAHGRDAAIIGEAVADHPGFVVMETRVGGRRVVEPPVGEPIPRVC